MSVGLTIINYDEYGNPYHLENFVTEVSYQCSLTKPCREVHMKVSFAIFSDAFPSHYIDTGSTMVIFSGDRNIFRGRVITCSMTNDEILDIMCYDYVWWLMRSKVCYNFENVSAKTCITTILDDLEIDYSINGILTGDAEDIPITHLINKKTAYQAIMQICTELHRNNGNYYYVFMDVSGNVGVRTCDKYWSNQTIKPCSDPTLPVPDGNIISFSYNRDMSEMLTRVKVYDSQGQPVNLNDPTSSTEDEDYGGD